LQEELQYGEAPAERGAAVLADLFKDQLLLLLEEQLILLLLVQVDKELIHPQMYLHLPLAEIQLVLV
jgi:hypothetical protein